MNECHANGEFESTRETRNAASSTDTCLQEA